MLKEFVFKDTDSLYRAKYNRYLSYVTWTYPYAQMAKQLVVEYDKELDSLKGKRDSKKYVNEAYEELKDKFTNGIMILTESQGKVLVKLIYRETGMTAYDIAYNYLGSVRAILWQTVSRAGGANLKLKFDPKVGDDIIIEDIVRKIERKEIFVPAEPFIPEDPHAYMKSRKKAYKAYLNDKKKIEKAKKKTAKTAITANAAVRK